MGGGMKLRWHFAGQAYSKCLSRFNWMTKHTENKTCSLQDLELDRKVIECQKLEIGKRKWTLGLEEDRPGGYLLGITRQQGVGD